MTAGEFSHIEYVIEQGIAMIAFPYRQWRSFEDLEGLKQELDTVAAEAEVAAMLLDFGGIEFFSSRIIGLLAALLNRLKKDNRRLVLCRLRPEPLRSLKMCRLDQRLPIFETKEDALRALATT